MDLHLQVLFRIGIQKVGRLGIHYRQGVKRTFFSKDYIVPVAPEQTLRAQMFRNRFGHAFSKFTDRQILGLEVGGFVVEYVSGQDFTTAFGELNDPCQNLGNVINCCCAYFHSVRFRANRGGGLSRLGHRHLGVFFCLEEPLDFCEGFVFPEFLDAP